MKILLIEDERTLRESVLDYLKKAGYLCEHASTFKEGIGRIISHQYDCVIADIGLPDGSGIDIVKELKKHNPNTGIIIISARNATEDKVDALTIGADDYLTKPFHLSELQARLYSVLRRRSLGGQNILTFREITLNADDKLVFVNELPVTLTKKEFQLLLYFLSNPNRVLTKEAIADGLWGENSEMASSLDFIYSHIKNLRKKLMDKGAGDYLKAVYGMGYRLSE